VPVRETAVDRFVRTMVKGEEIGSFDAEEDEGEGVFCVRMADPLAGDSRYHDVCSS